MGRVAERPGHQLFVGPVLHFASSEEVPGHEVSSLGNVVARNCFTWSPRLSRCDGQGREAGHGGRGGGGTVFQVTRVHGPRPTGV